MRLLKDLYGVYSPSKKEKGIKRFIVNYVKTYIPNTAINSDEIGNIYITKGYSATYPCIVAHLDQVQRTHSRDFTAVETEEIIFGYSPSNRQREGLGADDKNGIWIALKCLEKYDNIKIAFFVAEEIGCVGSNSADMDFFKDTRFVIEPDRKGFQDIITSIYMNTICSQEFLEKTEYVKFGYIETEGMMTDVHALTEQGIGISCINVSCGYYEPHTDNEFTVKADLLNCLRFVESIIENCQDTYPHTPEYPYMDYYGDYTCGNLEFEIWDILDNYPELTADEIYDIYHESYKNLRIEDIEQICKEHKEYNMPLN